ncbi:MAG: hypothetical protein Q8Q23_00425 [bacterium]|nr:hypothetical protein [bacterium]
MSENVEKKQASWIDVGKLGAKYVKITGAVAIALCALSLVFGFHVLRIFDIIAIIGVLKLTEIITYNPDLPPTKIQNLFLRINQATNTGNGYFVKKFTFFNAFFGFGLLLSFAVCAVSMFVSVIGLPGAKHVSAVAALINIFFYGCFETNDCKEKYKNPISQQWQYLLWMTTSFYVLICYLFFFGSQTILSTLWPLNVALAPYLTVIALIFFCVNLVFVQKKFLSLKESAKKTWKIAAVIFTIFVLRPIKIIKGFSPGIADFIAAVREKINEEIKEEATAKAEAKKPKNTTENEAAEHVGENQY